MQQAGIELQLLQLQGSDLARCKAALKKADLLVVGMLTIGAEIIATLSQCRALIRHGDGYDNMDIEAATAHGIICANKPGFWSEEVAEHALGLGLAIFGKRSLAAIQAWRCQQPDAPLLPASWDMKLSNQQIGIVGFGRSGKAVAARYRTLGATIVFHDPTLQPQELTDFARLNNGYRPRHLSLEQLFASSDIITLHLPATARNRHFLSWPQFRIMKRDVVVVNCARGSLIHTADLLRALREGEIGGAALDTTDPEPLPSDHPLYQLENCIITPHVAWYSAAALQRIRHSITEDIIAVRQGRQPVSVINPEVLHTPQCRLADNTD